jgi:hypothetical protein
MSKALTALVAVVALGAGAGAVGVSESGAQGDQVTVRAERFWDEACRCYKLRFSGTIPSAAANEYVAVLEQKCGSASSTAIAGASTTQGGAWQSEPIGPIARPGQDTSTYRARWDGRLSEPLTFRAKVPVLLTPLSGGRYRVTVSSSATGQSMNGRRIELQRLVAGRWTLVRRATLRGRGGNFTTTVTARGRNQSFRIFVPAKAAAPCYVATASQPFVAGRPPAPGSAAVIDRTLSCTTAVRGGLRMVDVGTFVGTQQPPLPRSASFNLMTNWIPDATLVSGSTAGIQLNPTRCTAASARVPLVSEGLRRTPSPSGDQEYKCEAPQRVLVRIHAVFHVPTKLEPDRTFGYATLWARGEVKEAQLAVRSPAGRNLAFASLSGGKVRLRTAPSCVEDS